VRDGIEGMELDRGNGLSMRFVRYLDPFWAVFNVDVGADVACLT